MKATIRMESHFPSGFEKCFNREQNDDAHIDRSSPSHRRPAWVAGKYQRNSWSRVRSIYSFPTPARLPYALLCLRSHSQQKRLGQLLFSMFWYCVTLLQGTRSFDVWWRWRRRPGWVVFDDDYEEDCLFWLGERTWKGGRELARYWPIAARVYCAIQMRLSGTIILPSEEMILV